MREKALLRTSPLTENCRLCGFPTVIRFSHLVLGKYDVSYAECAYCKSLQTSDPFWLSETYSGQLPNLDIGGARRALRSCSTVLLCSKVLALPKDATILDFGGGDGFVSRILRDCGFKAFVYDKYVRNTYAEGYSGNPGKYYQGVCAIEVFEHLARPDEEIARLFSAEPEMVIVATNLYSQQGPDWDYLGPDQGGHVFFFSEAAMKLIAAKYSYDVVTDRFTAVFSKSRLSFQTRFLLKLAIRPAGLLFGRLWLQLIRPNRAKATCS